MDDVKWENDVRVCPTCRIPIPMTWVKFRDKHEHRIKQLEDLIDKVYKIVDTGDITEPWIRQKIYSIIEELKALENK